MSVFEDALWLSGEQWIESFPADLPKHKFSRKHNRVINGILHGNQEKTKVKLSKGTIKVLLIAAILLALATTVFAVPAGREYIVEKFFNHSTYEVRGIDKINRIESFEINYIPDGFVITDEDKSKYFYRITYAKEQFHLFIDKHAINTRINFDTEEYDFQNITINGFDAILYFSENSKKGIIFNDGEYIFMRNGNIEKDELIKIAQNLK